MSHPDVSIITPAMNAAPYIGRAIASVQAQTFGSWELIVVDDGSADATAEIVADSARLDTRIRLVRNPVNAGIARARNAALECSSGRYLAFLDSDDAWDSAKLEEQVAFMRQRAAAVSFTDYRLVDPLDAPLGQVRSGRDTLTYRHLLRGFRMGCLTVMLDTGLIGKPRFPLVRKASDLALWLELLRPGRVAHALRRELATYRVVPTSISRAKRSYVGHVWDLYAAEPLHPIDRAACYSEYAVRGLLKHLTSGAVRVAAAGGR